MEPLEARVRRLEYYIELALDANGVHKKPFFEMVIQHELEKKEVAAIYKLCEEVYERYVQQKKEGLVNYMPLLTHFVGMLNIKLPPHQTIQALWEQGMYTDLMKELFMLSSQVRG
ncbi:DUF1878 family protein [Priestia koreensis]|uniref:DUF1878 family protein n=1 Tax=Priestia koreensis TaxID=284581 RepID=UPI0034583CB4